MWVNTRHYAVQLWVNTRHLTLAWHFTRTTCLLVIMRWKYQLFHKPGKPYKNFCRLSVMMFFVILGWGYEFAIIQDIPNSSKVRALGFSSNQLFQAKYLKHLQLPERRGKWLEGAPVAGADHNRWFQKKKNGERRTKEEGPLLRGGMLDLRLCTLRWAILVCVWVCSQFLFGVCVFVTSYGRSQQVGWGQLGRRSRGGRLRHFRSWSFKAAIQ